MYTDVDDFFPDSDSWIESPSYLGVSEDIDNETLNELELMGYDCSNPDLLMSGPFKRLFKKIRNRIRKRREDRAKKAAMAELGPTPPPEASFKMQTTTGDTVGYGPGGFQYQKYQPPTASAPGAMTANIMQDPMGFIQKNPMVLAIPAAILMMSILNK